MEGLSTKSWRAYHDVSRTATYGFLMALPLLIGYEVLIWLTNRGEQFPIRISAEVWMKRVLPTLGATGTHILAAVVLIMGVAIFMYERKKKIPLRVRYAGGMVIESAVYAVLLAFLVMSITQQIFAAAPSGIQMREASLAQQVALSIGAGLYEELLFRVILVGGLFVVARLVFENKFFAYGLAAVVGALLFSTVHYIGALGDSFTMSSFAFRAIFGLALNVLFLVRGFAIAAWTHALYDILVVTRIL